MEFDTWLLYFSTVLLLMSTPGPSHLLMLSVSLSNGFRRSLFTATGDLTANCAQMTLAGFGLATILTASQAWFSLVKWLGVAYLLWLGLRMIVHSFRHGGKLQEGEAAPPRALWLRGFITSAANPKAVVFFAALFPQFLNPEAPIVGQVLILGGTYLLIDGLFLMTYGKFASWLANQLGPLAQRWIARTSGVCLILSAALLGLKHQRS